MSLKSAAPIILLALAASVQAAEPHYLSQEGITRIDGDGTVRWSALEGVATDRPVSDGERLYVGSSLGLHALDPATGRELWRSASGATRFSPTLSGGTLFVSDTEGRLGAVDAGTGKFRWQRRFGGWVYPPAIQGDRLVTGGAEGLLRALSASDGRML